ncbi:MAG: hypothetical protein BGO98_04240 [Myxococcales bacterium 68-20]|nr:MAG: hypothetical protein BGO98_04240 [Myxococcales bacterium 68-20]
MAQKLGVSDGWGTARVIVRIRRDGNTLLRAATVAARMSTAEKLVDHGSDELTRGAWARSPSPFTCSCPGRVHVRA